MKKIVIILLLILPLLVNALTLNEAIEFALQNNKSLLISSEEQNSAYSNYKSIKGSILPQLSLSGSYGLQHTKQPDFLPENTLNKKEAIANTSLSFNQIIFSAGVFNGLEAARLYKSIQDEKLNLARKDIVFETRQKFYDVVLSESIVDIQSDAITTAEKHFEQVSNLYKAGLASEYDKLRAELEYENLKPELLEAQKNADLAKQSLSDFLGIKTSEIAINDTISLPIIDSFKLDYAISEGLRNRLEIKLAKLNEDIYHVQYKNEKVNFLPELFLTADLSSFTSSDSYDLGSDNFGTRASVNLNFQMPIFTGFTNKYNKRKTKSEYRIAQYELTDMNDNIELEIRNNYQKLKREKQSIDTSKKSIHLAQRGLKIAQSRYESKIGTILEIMDAQLNLKTSRLNYITAKYNLLITYETLIKSIGRDEY